MSLTRDIQGLLAVLVRANTGFAPTKNDVR